MRALRLAETMDFIQMSQCAKTMNATWRVGNPQESESVFSPKLCFYFHNPINRTSVNHLKGTKELGDGGKAVVSSSLVKLLRRGLGTLGHPWGR